MLSSRLSKNDSSVLSALFDPESSLSSSVQVDSAIVASSSTDTVKKQERLALRSINSPEPSSQEIEQAIALLTNIVEKEPSYASAWANRAQARRLLAKDDELLRKPALVAEIFEDLAQATSLATPAHADTLVSGDHAKVLASAHTHRGYLLLVASKSENNRDMLANVPTLGRLSMQDLEEAASRELAIGGRFGNETARQLAVKTNPYAKLCGSIVREALTKEISDFYQPQINMAG